VRFTLKTIFRHLLAPIVPVVLSTLFLISMLATNTSTVYAYLTYARWSGNSVEWRNYISGSPFPSNATALVASAANKWSASSTGKNFTFINYTNTPGPVRVSINSRDFASYGWPTTKPGHTRTLISNFRLSSGAVYLNSSWTWNTSCTLDEANKIADFRVIVLHELGHTVSLKHDSSHKGSVMWPNYTCKLQLRTDDKDGIGSLYQ
jgi:hypothetical protein